jgi:6-pyruvoyltetrahydropterin/6-carboxytetrahydropterin synthase
MYSLISECEFDSAHFLTGYPGKCANIHGHRWRVVCEIETETLIQGGIEDGMVTDFKNLRQALKKRVDELDHKLIYQTGTIKSTTETSLLDEGFSLCALPFRPTAENLSKYLYDQLKQDHWQLRYLTVYETPTNAATYREEKKVASSC